MSICKASTSVAFTLFRKAKSSVIAVYKVVGFLSGVVGCNILTSSCVGWSLSCLWVSSDCSLTLSILLANRPVGQLFIFLQFLQLSIFFVKLKRQQTSQYHYIFFLLAGCVFTFLTTHFLNFNCVLCGSGSLCLTILPI